MSNDTIGTDANTVIAPARTALSEKVLRPGSAPLPNRRLRQMAMSAATGLRLLQDQVGGIWEIATAANQAEPGGTASNGSL